MNRQIFPSALFPLRGDISAESGATSVIVQGIQGIPVVAPPIEPAGLDTLFYDSYNNDWFYASPWDIPVGIPLVWEGYGYGSSGISWIAPDTLAFGNGTDGDVSGAAAMTALVLFGSASYYGPYNDYDVDYGPSYDQFYTSVFSGATQNWNLILPPNPGTSGQVLTTNGTGVSSWSGDLTLNSINVNSTIVGNSGSVTVTVGNNGGPDGNIIFGNAANEVLMYSNGSTFLAWNVGPYPPTPSANSYGWLINFSSCMNLTQTELILGAQTLGWEGVNPVGGTFAPNVGISRLANSSLAIGNGTAADTTGDLSFNRVNKAGADLAGQATITAGNTTQAVTFSANYAGTGQPVIILTPTSDPLAVGVPVGYWVTYSGSSGAWTGFTVNIQTTLAGNVTFNYLVIGIA